MSTYQQTEPPVIHARVVMDPLADLPELFDEWRQEINALLCPERLRVPVHPAGEIVQRQDVWHLPDHELNLDVHAPFVPLDLCGSLTIEGQTIDWEATLDLDESKTVEATMRRRICVYQVSQI